MATAETVVEGCSHLSEEILDKLHMLGYDSGFLRQKSGFKPITADYFAIEINGNEQFNYFKALVKWLFSLNDIMSQDFDSFEDPNTVAQNMQFELRKLSVNVDVIASKIKKGSGEHVCEVLLGLIDATLKKRRVQFNSPVFPKQDDSSKMQKDIGGEDDDSVEIEGAGVAEDEDGDEVDLANYANKENKQVIESKANEKEWKNEVDKVRRQLESFTGVDQKEWRHHIENSKELTEKIGNEKPRIQAALEKLCDMMDKQLDRIGSREREINKVMVEIGEEFKNKSERYKELQTDIDVRTVRVKKLNDEYIALSAKNDQLQAKLSTLTNTTTNNQPLIQIKETIKHLRLEIQQMDVRIGVLNNIVWRHDFETRKQQLEETTGGRRNQERDFMRDTPDIAELDEEDEN